MHLRGVVQRPTDREVSHSAGAHIGRAGPIGYGRTVRRLPAATAARLPAASVAATKKR